MRSNNNNQVKTISISIIIIIIATLVAVNIFTPLKTNLKTFIKQKVTKDFLLSPNSISLPSPKLQDVEANFSVAFFSDSHTSTTNLSKAVSEINSLNVKYVFGLGDYSNVGTDKELKASKDQIDKLSANYFILPGDHDLWNGRDKSDNPLSFYNKYFDTPPTNFKDGNVEFVFIDNSDIYLGIPEQELEKIISTLQTSSASTIIVVTHKAIKHPLTIHTMGFIDDKRNELVFDQADRLDQVIKNIRNKNVYVVHGDLHSFGQYNISSPNISAYAIGALAEDKNFQKPRYATGIIDKNGKLHIQDRPISQ